jgi:hypothetical protein
METIVFAQQKGVIRGPSTLASRPLLNSRAKRTKSCASAARREPEPVCGVQRFVAQSLRLTSGAIVATVPCSMNR